MNKIDRDTAFINNPFIGVTPAETADNIQNGLEFLSIAVHGLADGSSESAMAGFSVMLDTMKRAMQYESKPE